MGNPTIGGDDHAQTGPVGSDRWQHTGPTRGVSGEAEADRPRRGNPLAPLWRVCGALFAWLGGLVAAFTGQLDWTIAGHAMAGERFVFVLAVAGAAAAFWWLGERTEHERRACRFSLLAALVAFIAAPISFAHLSPGWWAHQVPVWLLHVGLCLQLAAWASVARKAQRRGLWILFAGAACEAFVIFPIAQFKAVDAACTAGMRMTCEYGAFVAVALPAAAVTLALVLFWLNPIERGLRGRRGR